jgi:hypothetical protein
LPRGRTLIWTIIGTVVAIAVVVIVASRLDSGSPSSGAPLSTPPVSGGTTTQPPSTSAPVVTPPASGSPSYLSDLHPSGGLGELVNPGPVKISGSIYPKSISFYCNVGDPTAFPAYKLKHNERRFQATIGLPATSSSQFKAIILIKGDGRTLRTVTVSAAKPKTVDVSLRKVRKLQLECFGSGNSYTGGEAIVAVWGNARIAGGR